MSDGGNVARMFIIDPTLVRRTRGERVGKETDNRNVSRCRSLDIRET